MKLLLLLLFIQLFHVSHQQQINPCIRAWVTGRALFAMQVSGCGGPVKVGVDITITKENTDISHLSVRYIFILSLILNNNIIINSIHIRTIYKYVATNLLTYINIYTLKYEGLLVGGMDPAETKNGFGTKEFNFQTTQNGKQTVQLTLTLRFPNKEEVCQLSFRSEIDAQYYPKSM